MGDHFVFLVDRLLTESTLVAALESRDRSMLATEARDHNDEMEAEENSSHVIDLGDPSYPKKMVECRICQDEDDDRNMEMPCSCCGSLRYAHRKCVQRWCNEKGNTVCEICHQQFKPGYTAPPPLFQFGRIPMNFRGNWEVYRRELNPNGPRLIAMVSTDHHNFADPNLEEQTALATTSLMCCRSVALVFMILLVLRHTLPVIASGIDEHSFPLLMLLLLRSMGIVLPIYIMMRLLVALQRHRLRRVSLSSSADSSDNETEDLSPQPQPLTIHVG